LFFENPKDNFENYSAFAEHYNHPLSQLNWNVFLVYLEPVHIFFLNKQNISVFQNCDSPGAFKLNK